MQNNAHQRVSMSHSFLKRMKKNQTTVCGRFLVMTLSFVAASSDPEIKRTSAPILLLDLNLPSITPDEYLKSFWHDTTFYENFLKESGDRDVSIKSWSPAQPSTHSVAHHKITHRTRTIVTKHPVKTKMPGIPSHVRSTKTQVLSEEKINRNGSVIIRVHETNEVEGVPFADRFLVAVVWTATWTDHTSEEERKNNPKTVRLTVHQHVIFRQSFLLEKMVERDSRKETLDTVKLWSTLVHQQVMASEGAPSSTPLQGGDEGQEAKAKRDHESISTAVTRKVLVTGAAAVFILLVGKTAFYLPDELARLARCRRQKPNNQ